MVIYSNMFKNTQICASALKEIEIKPHLAHSLVLQLSLLHLLSDLRANTFVLVAPAKDHINKNVSSGVSMLKCSIKNANFCS